MLFRSIIVIPDSRNPTFCHVGTEDSSQNAGGPWLAKEITSMCPVTKLHRQLFSKLTSTQKSLTLNPKPLTPKPLNPKP